MDPMYINNWNATKGELEVSVTRPRRSESEDNTAMNPLLRYGRPGTKPAALWIHVRYNYLLYLHLF